MINVNIILWYTLIFLDLPLNGRTNANSFRKKNERNMYYRAVVNEIVDIFKKGTLISTNINETTDSCLIVGDIF